MQMVLTVLLLLWLVRRLTRENAPATEAPEEGVEGEMGYSLKSMMSLQKLQKWFYRGGRPNRMARILNRLGAAVYALGIAPNYLVTLEVAGDPVGSSVFRSSWLSLRVSAISYPCSERK